MDKYSLHAKWSRALSQRPYLSRSSRPPIFPLYYLVRQIRDWRGMNGWWPEDIWHQDQKSSSLVCPVSTDNSGQTPEIRPLNSHWSVRSRVMKEWRYGNQWVILLSSKFKNSTTLSDRLPTARYCPLGENWATATSVTSKSPSNIPLPISLNLTRTRVERGPRSSKSVEAIIRIEDLSNPLMQSFPYSDRSEWTQNQSPQFETPLHQTTAQWDNTP